MNILQKALDSFEKETEPLYTIIVITLIIGITQFVAGTIFFSTENNTSLLSYDLLFSLLIISFATPLGFFVIFCLTLLDRLGSSIVKFATDDEIDIRGFIIRRISNREGATQLNSEQCIVIASAVTLIINIIAWPLVWPPLLIVLFVFALAFSILYTFRRAWRIKRKLDEHVNDPGAHTNIKGE